MRTHWKHSHHEANDMFAWFPSTYGVTAARPSGAMQEKLKSTYTRSHSAEICSLCRSTKLRPMFLSSSDASPRTEVPRNRTRDERQNKRTTHPDDAPWFLGHSVCRETEVVQQKTPQQGYRPVSPREIGELRVFTGAMFARNTTSKQTKNT